MKGRKEKRKMKNVEKTAGFKSVCIYGGTFDPVHNGHLILANIVKETLCADKMLFVPSYRPPHKTLANYSRYEHRYAMLQKATENNPDFMVSDIEYLRKGPSYSHITIDEVKDRFNLSTRDLYFLIGGDSLVNFNQWKNPEKILDSCRVVVMARSNYNFENVEKKILDRVRILSTPLIELSSTDIRYRVQHDLSIQYMVPEVVEQLIQEKRLYI